MNQDEALKQLEAGAKQGKLSEGAVENIRAWLTEPHYAPYAQQVADHLAEGKWQALDDAFWTVIPFGTGGRRGRMYPIGSNAINDRTIGESAQGLADYVKRQRDEEQDPTELSCGIAYDTRHKSRHFAELCAGIMVAAGFRVFFLDDYRSTPELSFLVRFKSCTCGIMVTASHNPPRDNAVKVYSSTGGQLLPPHDHGVIREVMTTKEIRQVPFAEAVADGRIVICTEEVDSAYLDAVQAQSFAGPRDLKILFSPLHGVATSAVVPTLQADGFDEVEVYPPHAEPSGDFPNVPNHSANPENPEVFDDPIQYARSIGAGVVLATDPDGDRVGCAAPTTTDPQGPWAPFTGNQIAVLLADYVLEQRKSRGSLAPENYIVKTLVTTEMLRRVADSYQVKTQGNLHVGFKWIGGIIDQVGPDLFVFGAEESHGYLVGQHVRDKDGVVATMLMAELAAKCHKEGLSLHEKLDALYWQHGYHAERLLNITMEGSEGMSRMQTLMRRLREDPPEQLAGMRVARVRDYLRLRILEPGQPEQPLEAPAGDVVFLDFAEDGNYVAARPSGTEPKVKFYMFTYTPAEQLADLDDAKQAATRRLDEWEKALHELVGT
jgi:phosphomannomutase